MNEIYPAIITLTEDCIEDETRWRDFLKGECLPAQLNTLVSKDEVWLKLVENSNHDEDVSAIVKSVFESWVVLMADHLEGGSMLRCQMK